MVSVVIAAYEAATFVSRAIASALNQAGVTLEVIVVDDASSDSTTDVVEGLRLQDRRVRLVRRRQNGGPSAARNAGISAARGDWIAILDADDVFAPKRLIRLLALAREQQVDLIADNVCYYDWHTKLTSPAQATLGVPHRVVSAATFVEHARPYTGSLDWGLFKPMVQRAFLLRHGIKYAEYSRHGEDFLFVFDCLLAGGHYIVSEEAGYLYTLRGSGLSRTTVDYFSMARQSLELLKRPDVVGDALLQLNLRARVGAVRRLARQRLFEQHVADRQIIRLLGDFAVDPKMAWLLARRIVFKFAVT